MGYGFVGLPELAGVWPSAPRAVAAGFVGVEHLSGVWLTGPPGPGEYRGGREHRYRDKLDHMREQILREDKEIIAIIIAAVENGVIL